MVGMSNNHITINDFENICRTCLSRLDLKPLYEKCVSEKLTFFTYVKFVEDDGLPGKICTNCIHEINQAFSFAKLCETTDAILRKCLNKIGLTNYLSEYQNDEPIIKVDEELKIEMKREIIFPNTRRCVQEVLGEFKDIEEVKQEDVKLKLKPEIISSNMHQTMEEVWIKQEEEDMNIEYECDTINYDSREKNYEENDDEDQDEMYSEKCDNSGSTCDDSLDSHSKHVCSVCSKIFTYSSKLSLHMRMHTGEKPYSCEVCNKAFTQANYLKSHMRMHTGEKPYSCKVCSKAFNHATSLKIHVRIHTGENPYTCTVCSKAFSHNTGLIIHMRMHTGEKPYTCKVCNKAFIQAGDLKNHMRMHTGEKPYGCKVCSKAFAQTSNLKNHMRMHTGEKPYTCNVCTKAFVQSGQLKRHMRVHTGKSLAPVNSLNSIAPTFENVHLEEVLLGSLRLDENCYKYRKP